MIARRLVIAAVVAAVAACAPAGSDAADTVAAAPADQRGSQVGAIAPRLDSRSIVAAAVTLHSVETRHAAWIRYLNGLPPVTGAFDKPASQQRMARLIASTGFVARRARTARRARPRFTG